MLESLRGFPSCMPSALKLASVLFIECSIIVGVGLLIARGIARVLLKAYHVRTYDPSTTSRHFGAKTKSNPHIKPITLALSILWQPVFFLCDPMSQPYCHLVFTGFLSAVGSLMMTVQNSTISLTWTAPFTLDITGVDPDITYCVGVVNSTSSSTLHSECGITETEYEYPIPPDSACHDHMVTAHVTPINVVGNGTSSTLTSQVYHEGII